jgi:hypothetical protein
MFEKHHSATIGRYPVTRKVWIQGHEESFLDNLMPRVMKKSPDKWYEVIHKLERKILKWLCTKFELQLKDDEKRKILHWMQKVKEKRRGIDINIELMMKFPWLQKINEYKIDEGESTVLMEFLRDKFQTPFKVMNDKMQLNFDAIKQMIDETTVYIIDNEEIKKWKSFNVKGKWKDESLKMLNRKTIFNTKVDGCILKKLLK